MRKSCGDRQTQTVLNKHTTICKVSALGVLRKEDRVCVCVYYCRTWYEAVCVCVGGILEDMCYEKLETTSEPRPVCPSLPITH